MKILIVCSANSGKVAPFIQEQVEALTMNFDVECSFFLIKEKGPLGYLKHLPLLRKTIQEYKPDIIHAHYGYSGLLANLQRKTPVITTYHGSDINVDAAFILSKLSIYLSSYNIFVSLKNLTKANKISNSSLIPCAVDTNTFYPSNKDECRKDLRLDINKKYVLFSNSFDIKVKNAPLAKSAISLMDNVVLLELKGYKRKDVAKLMNAVDVCLMTSISEGSPQFIKEAMACNCPIVSVNVGDVKEVIAHTEGCFVSDTYKKEEIAEKIKMALQFGKRTTGRERIFEMGLDTKSVSEKLMQIYNQAVNR